MHACIYWIGYPESPLEGHLVCWWYFTFLFDLCLGRLWNTAACILADWRMVSNKLLEFYSANQDTLKQLYTSLVCPHLEYACQVWDPHLVKDKKALEDVQKFGCRLAAHQWDSGYQELLDLFELQSLEQCRLDFKLGLMFRIIHRLCYFPGIPDFRQNLSNLRVSHPLQLDPPLARTNAYKFSYFPHTMSAWNSLSNNCVTSTSYISFMKQLKLNV